ALALGGRGEVVAGAGADLGEGAVRYRHRNRGGNRVRDRPVVAGGEELGPRRDHRWRVADAAPATGLGQIQIARARVVEIVAGRTASAAADVGEDAPTERTAELGGR
ncbi:MAG: hypothetical protein JWM24_2108, partial [Solirubrobacterales bacterium]|nr:hypothetical protein [Solirubrobacterales bacterium]